MRDSRKSTNSLVSNNSSLKKTTKMGPLPSAPSPSSITAAERNISTDRPLPQILKQTLKKARDALIQKGIINESSLIDKEKFPTYDVSDPMKCTPRELTLKLVKQHDFLLHRVVALTEAARKTTLSRYAEGTDLMKDLEAEETVSRQDVSIRSLKRENSFMKKQLESFRL